jgi:hypothetical protein
MLVALRTAVAVALIASIPYGYGASPVVGSVGSFPPVTYSECEAAAAGAPNGFPVTAFGAVAGYPPPPGVTPGDNAAAFGRAFAAGAAFVANSSWARGTVGTRPVGGARPAPTRPTTTGSTTAPESLPPVALVLVPAGVFVTGSFNLTSQVYLCLEDGAEVRGSDSGQDYVVVDSITSDTGPFDYPLVGAPMRAQQPLIVFMLPLGICVGGWIGGWGVVSATICR